MAVADFTKAIESDPDFLAAYYNRGVAYFDQGKYDLAIADFTKAMELGLKGKGVILHSRPRLQPKWPVRPGD